MTLTATQTATRFGQTATRPRGVEGPRTVGVMVSDSHARARVVEALRGEGFLHRIVTASDFVDPADAPAALVYDLAPWSDTARDFVKRLRYFPWHDAALPILVYAPPRPEVAQLLMEVAAFEPIRGVFQTDEARDVRRVREAVRHLLRDAPGTAVFHAVMRCMMDVPPDVRRICRFACEKLAARAGTDLTVTRVAAELAADRRTLERRFQALELPNPKELLDWIVVVFAAWVAERKGISSYTSGPLLGLSDERLRRTRLRLRRPFTAYGGVQIVLSHLERRIRAFHVRPGLLPRLTARTR